MIYLVSNDVNLIIKVGDVKTLSIQESLDVIDNWPLVQFDTETTGLDPRVCKLTSMQFGYKDFKTGEHTEIVVDCNSVDPVNYITMLESKLLVGHNLKFDLQFLYNYGIAPLNVYDTMICEQVLYLGYKPGRVSYRLADVLYRYTGKELDKTFQKQIATKGLTKEGVVYAANDVVHLQDIRKAQFEIAKSRNCLGALYVENRFVPAIAYLEWCGVHLDEEKWKAKMSVDKTQFDFCKKRLDDYVISQTKLNDKYVSTYYEATLFDAPDTTHEPYCTIDWASPAQCVPVFQTLGFNTKTFDKKTHREKDSIEEKVIANQKGIDDTFLEYYLDYKDAEKKVSTYGQGHLDQINPNTGRLHTVFNQLGTVTGRMSSGAGSKTKNNDLAKLKKMPKDSIGYCNLQNLPARGEMGKITRACFTAEKGNVFISSDFSAEESRVQADVWEEKSLLESFENGIDTHNLYAKLCFPDELKDVDVKDVKKVRPDLRQAAKSAEFALGYGSDGSSIAATIGMPVEKARAMVQGILKGMPGMAAFKKKTIKFLKEHGYIVINKYTGHRIHWPEWAAWKAQEDMMDQNFWTDYRMYHQGTNDSVAQMVRAHNSESKDWFEKNVLNYPIQGGSAIVLKQAAADLFEWVVKNGLFNIVLFCVFVHDEIDCECPANLSERVAKKVKSIMEHAAKMYYRRLPIPAEYSISDHWVH